MVEAEAAVGVGEDIGSAGVGCGGGCGGVDERKAGGSVAYVIGSEEIDVGVADGLEAAVGSALYVCWSGCPGWVRLVGRRGFRSRRGGWRGRG